MRDVHSMFPTFPTYTSCCFISSHLQLSARLLRFSACILVRGPTPVSRPPNIDHYLWTLCCSPAPTNRKKLIKVYHRCWSPGLCSTTSLYEGRHKTLSSHHYIAYSSWHLNPTRKSCRPSTGLSFRLCLGVSSLTVAAVTSCLGLLVAGLHLASV